MICILKNQFIDPNPLIFSKKIDEGGQLALILLILAYVNKFQEFFDIIKKTKKVSVPH
jgi:hypothetical protein